MLIFLYIFLFESQSVSSWTGGGGKSGDQQKVDTYGQGEKGRSKWVKKSVSRMTTVLECAFLLVVPI